MTFPIAVQPVTMKTLITATASNVQ